LTKEQPVTIRPKDKVLIEERLDGSLWICLRGKYLNYQVLLTKLPRQQKQLLDYSCLSEEREKEKEELETTKGPSLEKTLYYQET